MLVSPVDLNFCGSCYYQPLVDIHGSDKTTLYDEIKGKSTDISNPAQYGYSELWVPPVMLLLTQKGDCEDGAFLIMSLGLNAGVDPLKLRMYGGFVQAGQGAASGGHGWVAFRRELGNDWVAVDFSYYPDLRPMGDRIPLKDDAKYVDDYFFITNKYIVVTEETNRVREPEVYYSDGRVIPNIFFPRGSLVSWYS
jgi:hypothetical protein